MNTAIRGDLPGWLLDRIDSTSDEEVREEIEIKFILPKNNCLTAVKKNNPRIQNIEQIYIDINVLKETAVNILPDNCDTYTEWRVRRNNDEYFVTGKSETATSITRNEFQRPISTEMYNSIIKTTGKNKNTKSVKKIRQSFELTVGKETILVEVDNFKEVAGNPVNLDFVYCELELKSKPLARSIQSGLVSIGALETFVVGLEVTRFREFKNAWLAEYGFPAETFHKVNAWVQNACTREFQQMICKADPKEIGHVMLTLEQRNQIGKSELKSSASAKPPLAELRFDVGDTYGRSARVPEKFNIADNHGYGWLRDFQKIVSSDPFLRLFSKPQIFRPGLGNNTTTTRGQHTLDVISSAQNIANQTGLNDHLAAAIAALHDLGHPAGGHKGEEFLSKLSRQSGDGTSILFKHHIYSLSLAEIFDFNLQREVQIGAFYHKSGGKKLTAPANCPQEFGVVRIADKISYVPWDIHDSIKNNFLKKGDVPQWIYDELGSEPPDWIITMIDAIVDESQQEFSVTFSEKSGKVFKAYEAARKIVYDNVHSKIFWQTLEVQYELSFQILKNSFPDIDPIPILAYMTDSEIEQIAKHAEANPIGTSIDLEYLKDTGMGVVEILEHLAKIKEAGEWDQKVFFHHMERHRLK